ncbi:MAG: hypothetical protein LBR97_04910 [Dysgonamonadaceae bacterium]|jgi:hypothetical protein|nr:hypothetical protein [Dysgonamonadaceae bacterium]
MAKNISNKNYRQKNRPPVKQTPAKQTKQTVSAGNGFPIWLVKNVCAVLAAGFILFKCIEVQPGYNWAYNGLLKGNMSTIRKYPDATLEQRNEMKLGFDHTYLQFLKKETPEDAVILYPSPEDFFPEGMESPFKQDVSTKTWGLRVLYPRKIVLPSEMETNRYAKDITHVAIVNGRGYERVDYKVETPFAHGVLPVKR